MRKLITMAEWAGKTIVEAKVISIDGRLIIIFSPTDETPEGSFSMVCVQGDDGAELFTIDSMKELFYKVTARDLANDGVWSKEDADRVDREWREAEWKINESATRERELKELARLKAKYGDVAS